MSTNNPPLVDVTDPETGRTLRRVAGGGPGPQSISEARAQAAAMPPGPRRDAYVSRLRAEEQAITTRAQTAASEVGLRTAELISAANAEMNRRANEVHAAVDALRMGTMDAADGDVLYRAIVRDLANIDRGAEGLRETGREIARNVSDPIAAHERLLTRFPALRTRGVV